MMEVARMKSTIRIAGFTLVELLVVITIMGVVTSLGTSAFVTITGAWNESKAMSQLDAQASSAFAQMHLDFADVLSADLSGAPIEGLERNWRPAEGDQKKMYFDKVLENDVVVLPVQTLGGGREREDFSMISYSVQRKDGGHILVRTVGNLIEDEDLNPQYNVVDPDLANVIRFRVEFSDAGGNWEPEWSGDAHPLAVRVSMTLEEPGRGRQHLQIMRKAVFPIHVR